MAWRRSTRSPELLQAHFLEAKSKNPRFSLRAFARRLGVYPSTLSGILSGKRTVTPKMSARMLARLPLDAGAKSRILERIKEKSERPKDLDRLPLDQYRLIADWHYFAILSLAETTEFAADPDWIARRLNLSTKVAKEAMERLTRLGLLNVDGSLVPKRWSTSDDVRCLSLRKAHRRNLELAAKSLDIEDLAIRDFSAMTMAINPKKIPLAKKRIRKFHEDMSRLLEKGHRSEVYKLCVQFIPLTVREDDSAPH